MMMLASPAKGSSEVLRALCGQIDDDRLRFRTEDEEEAPLGRLSDRQSYCVKIGSCALV